MTADELLERIRETDPGAYLTTDLVTGQRLLITESVESDKIVAINPATMHIVRDAKFFERCDYVDRLIGEAND